MGLFSKKNKDKRRKNVINSDDMLYSENSIILNEELVNEKNLDAKIEIYNKMSLKEKIDDCLKKIKPFTDKHQAKIETFDNDDEIVINFKVENIPVELRMSVAFQQSTDFYMKFTNKMGTLDIDYFEDTDYDDYNHSDNKNENGSERFIFLDRNVYIDNDEDEAKESIETVSKIPGEFKNKLIEFIKNENINFVRIFEDEIGFDLNETYIILKDRTDIYDRVINMMLETVKVFS